MRRFNLKLYIFLKQLTSNGRLSISTKNLGRQNFCEGEAGALKSLDSNLLRTGIAYGHKKKSQILLRNHYYKNNEPLEEKDFLQAIAVPFEDPSTQYFVTGFDGFPAFGFKQGASIKHPYRLFLPERLYREFSLLVATKPETRDKAFLFAVTNPLENLIQLGLSLTPGDGSSTNISLYYTDGERHMTSQTIATFIVPDFAGMWTRFAFSVTETEVQLWFNCQLFNSVAVKRVPEQLMFDTASTLYIAQAGGIFKGEFQGALQELRIYNAPEMAKVQCDESVVVTAN
ncbi:unnamed protein product, partial [Meganyctiphanes norvegica]